MISPTYGWAGDKIQAYGWGFGPSGSTQVTQVSIAGVAAQFQWVEGASFVTVPPSLNQSNTQGPVMITTPTATITGPTFTVSLTMSGLGENELLQIGATAAKVIQVLS